ncbi:MAG: hypothetical protein K8R36_16045 [Planctomycetales bacterium]|nr:hypothetical protein [Planctomycetales bacterium]
MANQLFDDRYAPITSEIEFLECDAKTAADAFQEWQRPIQSGRGVRINRQELNGCFPTKIECLLPLTSVERRRFLFMPTKSNWTACLDNGWRGNDVSAVSHLSRAMRCRAIRADCVPHTMRKTPTGEIGRYGATIFELYAADSSGGSFLSVQRSIFSANDGGRWKFGANEQPLDFEQLERYTARQIRDRFTSEMLDEYLRHFGIQFFSPDFYELPQPAYLISKEGPCAVGMKEYSLDEARATF